MLLWQWQEIQTLPWSQTLICLLKPLHCPDTTMSKLIYPKIPGSSILSGQSRSLQCVAFEKYDGSNLHWQWERDFGWHAFGTRREVFQLTNPGIADFTARHQHLAQAPAVFNETLAQPLASILEQHPLSQHHPAVKVFTEFCGPNSFAGLHHPDDPKTLWLLDVWFEDYGWLAPAQFVEDFAIPQRAQVVYRGKLSGQFAEDVRGGRYRVAEGVVCKGGSGGSDVWMVKIKTDAYMQRLKTAFAERWEDYWE
jgi:hypothetical protein